VVGADDVRTNVRIYDEIDPDEGQRFPVDGVTTRIVNSGPALRPGS